MSSKITNFRATCILLATLMPLLPPATALAKGSSGGGKAYVFLGGKLGNLGACSGRLSIHSRGDSGGRDVSSAVARTRAGETITVGAHSDGSVFASRFIQEVKKKNPNANIRYVNFEGFRPNGGGRPGLGTSQVAGLKGVQTTCVTMPGAPNYKYLVGGPGCTVKTVAPPKGCGSWCRHYAVMSCDML